ncbi:hypothetical protein HQQ94_21380 [Shewanella sp. VB17]|uniref:hypothetical protein n=1 Tax=Shewanella sp. VB17 TaxID=2739432 RepID=UPI001564DE9A|nr:hypothetical protein [Shewanella sp. VB17]NRD75724.1 hypothetical protein [Shewanella sp. VB17]
MSLSAIFSEAYNFFRNHISQLAALTIPILFIQVSIQLWLGMEMMNIDMENPQFSGLHMVAVMALLLVFSFLIATLTIFLELRSQGHEANTALILKTSLNFVPGLLLAGVLSGLMILAPVMLFAAFGPLWLVGLTMSIYVFARLTYVNFMVVVERLTPLEAIKGSFKLSGPIAFKTLMVLMLYIPISLIGGSLSTLAQAVGFPLQLMVEVLVAFLGLFVNIALFRIYMIAGSKSTD